MTMRISRAALAFALGLAAVPLAAQADEFSSFGLFSQQTQVGAAAGGFVGVFSPGGPSSATMTGFSSYSATGGTDWFGNPVASANGFQTITGQSAGAGGFFGQAGGGSAAGMLNQSISGYKDTYTPLPPVPGVKN